TKEVAAFVETDLPSVFGYPTIPCLVVGITPPWVAVFARAGPDCGQRKSGWLVYLRRDFQSARQGSRPGAIGRRLTRFAFGAIKSQPKLGDLSLLSGLVPTAR